MAQQPKWTPDELQALADGISAQVFADLESKMKTGTEDVQPVMPLLASQRTYVVAALVTVAKRVVESIGLSEELGDILDCGDCHEELAGRAFIVWTIKGKSTPLCLECSAFRNRSIDLQ